MLSCSQKNVWEDFLKFMKEKCSDTEFQNWLAPIKVLESSEKEITLEVPNIFVKNYLLDNYKKEIAAFLPLDDKDEPAINFVVSQVREIKPQQKEIPENPNLKFNTQYTFENFIEGPSNQFVKSAALGVAAHPGKSFNPLFIHGGVGLGKTHLLHGIGHYVKHFHKKLTCQCITTESFINDIVNHLRDKSIDKMKRYYRNLDVLLVDDIQFLQNRQNFEEEFCNTFESLINQNKQVVITSDKPPSQLKLSERMVARLEWGLVAHIDIPELETRAAIIQHKALLKGIKVSSEVAFFIADHIYNNVRQLEGAINRLSAFCRLMKAEPTKEVVEMVLQEMLQLVPKEKITVESILKSVSSVFEVTLSDLKSSSRIKEVANARQAAMYLAKELLKDSLIKIASSFGGKTHSTLLHAWKKISEEIKTDEKLSRQIQMVRRNIEI